MCPFPRLRSHRQNQCLRYVLLLSGLAQFFYYIDYPTVGAACTNSCDSLCSLPTTTFLPEHTNVSSEVRKKTTGTCACVCIQAMSAHDRHLLLSHLTVACSIVHMQPFRGTFWKDAGGLKLAKKAHSVKWHETEVGSSML
jgi:hypothetical protein